MTYHSDSPWSVLGVTCDAPQCDAERSGLTMAGWPAAWVLSNRPPPGWAMVRREEPNGSLYRRDYCPKHKALASDGVRR